jgi:hypothetical protein
VRSNTDRVPKPSSPNCPDASCPSQAGLPQNPMARQRSSCRKPLLNRGINPISGQGGVRCAIQSGCRNRTEGIEGTMPRRSPHHGPPSEHPEVKRAAYRVQGLSIGTQELTCSRRLVADRLALWSRATTAREDGALVVVGGRESRPQGEGGQVRNGLVRRRNRQWTLSIKRLTLGSSTFNASSDEPESPVHNERCTPGLGTGAGETTPGNCGIGAPAPCSLDSKGADQ